MPSPYGGSVNFPTESFLHLRVGMELDRVMNPSKVVQWFSWKTAWIGFSWE
jgi:hypothetical protein